MLPSRSYGGPHREPVEDHQSIEIGPRDEAVSRRASCPKTERGGKCAMPSACRHARLSFTDALPARRRGKRGRTAKTAIAEKSLPLLAA
jgi:hypothetical protein